MIQSLMIRTVKLLTSLSTASPVPSICNVSPLKLTLLLRTLEDIKNVAPPDEIINLLSSKATLLEQTLQSRELLLNIPRVLLALLSNLAIVLSILLLSATNSFLKLLLRLSTTSLQSADNVVQRRDRASNGVKTTTCNTESAGFVVQEGHEVGFAAAGVVGDCFGRAGGVVFDCRVGFHSCGLRDGFGVGRFAVDLGDEDGGLGGEVFGEFFPDWGEGFAVCEGGGLVGVFCFHLIRW
jgi:hypothetical protein